MELPVEDVRMSDTITPLRDGTMREEKVVEFYLGKYGPFRERFPAAEFDDLQFQQRVDKLRRTIEGMHR